MLDNFDNLQASWVTQGGKVGQLSLAYGANDMGSVMIEENVVRAAGASYCMDEVEIVRNIEDAGFVAKRRNMHYEHPRRSDLPRARRAADARTGHRARGRRRQRARRTAELSGAEPRRQAASRHPHLIRYHASWVLPIVEPPIRDGWVAVERGRIVASARRGTRASADGALTVDLGRVAILPGLVNAHTHLELSYLRERGAAVRRHFVDLDSRRRSRRGASSPMPKAPEILDAVRARRSTKRSRCGTAVVGDISNTLVTVRAARRGARSRAIVFYELIRFNAADPVGVRRAGASRDRGACADRAGAREPGRACAVLGRAAGVSRDSTGGRSRSVRCRAACICPSRRGEVEFIRTGDGPWRSLLEEVGVVGSGWVAPGGSPVAVSRRRADFSVRGCWPCTACR